MTNYLVVEDHPITARATAGLVRSLADGPAQVDVAYDLDGTKERLRSTRYSVVFVDLVLPGCDGTQSLAWVRQLAPQARAIVLSGRDEPVLVRQCFDLGAFAYLFKGLREDELEQAIRDVLSGRRVWPPMADQAQMQPPDWPARLTAREHDVLMALVRTQQSTKRLAKVLGMTPGTVKTHLNSVMKKAGLHNRAELIVAARDLGLVGASGTRRATGGAAEVRARA